MAKIFIPEIKKKYTIIEDLEILLYPFQHYEFKEFESGCFYAKYDKKAKEFKTIMNVEMIPYLGNEDKWRNDNSVTDFFLKTDKPIDKGIEALINSPNDLLKIGNPKSIFLIIRDYNNWSNDSFIVFLKEPKKVDYTKFYKEEKPSRFEKFPEKRLQGYKEYAEEFIKEEQNVWMEALKMNPLLDKIIDRYIPIKYKISKGKQVSILKLIYKDNRNIKTKIPLSQICLDGKTLIILREDLNNFNLE